VAVQTLAGPSGTSRSSPTEPARRPRWRERDKQTLAAWLFLLPSLIGFVIFTAGPVIAAGVISLLEWNLFSPPSWAGLRNFARLGGDPTFWSALGNTAYFTFASVPLTILVSLALALLLNQGLRRVAVFRSLLLLPYATITVAVAFVWIWLYIPDGGLINAVLGLVGINGPDWLVSETWAMPALIAMSVWKSFGFGMVVFLAGLQAIHTADAVACGLLRDRHLDHRLVPGVRPGADHDQRWSGIRDHHTRHVHLPNRVRELRRGICRGAVACPVRVHRGDHRGPVRPPAEARPL
jgi:multiple sugar transport system permease protein